MKRNLATIFVIFIAGVVYAAPAGSADMPVRGFDGTSYEYSYSGAERANAPERWLQEARSGVAFAIARWERDAVGLYADPASLAAARMELEVWSAADIAIRFSAWLRDRFFGREATELRYAVAEATRTANEQYLYVLDADGAVTYDEAGNPRYLPPEEGLPLEQTKLAWNSGTASAARIALESYGARLESLCPELLSFIPEIDRGLYAPLIVAAIGEARTAISREFDNLVAREERLFVARKTVDVWSLRNQSEGEAASVVAAALAREATTDCDEGLAALNARVEAASVGGGDLALAGADWLAAFKVQFDRGLTTWKNAEERFMVRRLEWERDATQAFDAGNEAWAKAFETLTKERQAWETRSGSLFKSGEDAFSRASETLETNIREARAEFEQATFERCTAGSDRASAWVDVYLQAGATAAGAREGASYWLSLLGSGVPAFSDPTLGPWLASEAATMDTSQQRKDWLAQASDCLQVYDQYAAKACESRDRLVADFGLAIGSGSGSLRDVLDAGALAEDFCLDEYQLELIRAKAIEGYWARRVEIADAVLQYAVDLSSGRATAGDNIRNLEAASMAWKEALRLYDEAQAQLKEAGAVVTSSREALSSAQETLAAAGARLENIDAEYSILMGVMRAGDASFIGDAIRARYRDLIEQSGYSEANGVSSEASLLASYLEKARALGYAIDIERSGEALRDAVNGIDGEPSLAQLKSGWDAILVPADPSSVSLDIATYGIPETATEHAAVQTLLMELRSRLDRAGTALERDLLLESFGLLVSRNVGIAKSRAAVALESRLDRIALLGSSSAAAWYADRTGGRILDGSLATVLAEDERIASRSRLLARAELELQAAGIVSGILPEQRASDDANSLAGWWTGGGASAEAAWTSLASLVDFLHANSNADDAVFNAGIETLARSDATIAWFVRGKGYFQTCGLDIGSMYGSSQIEALERAHGRLTACLGDGSSAMALEVERYSAALDALGEALIPLGLALGEQGILPGAKAIITALFTGGTDTSTVLAGLLSAADEAAAAAPGWIALELSGWKESLLEYAAAKSQYLGLPLSVSSADYRAVLDHSSEQIVVFSTVLDGLAGDESSALRSLCLLALEPIWSVAEIRLLEDETARRMALALRASVSDFNIQNSGGDPDWVAFEATLASEADRQFGFSAFGIRTKAVELALESLLCIDAIVNSRNPSLLTGAALEARLTDVWTNIDIEESRTIAASGGNPVARIAYSMRALVFDGLTGTTGEAVREDILALRLHGPEGEPSWLDDYYASEGQDSGTVMQYLLDIAAGDDTDPWNIELAWSRVEAAAVDSLSGLIAYRDELRRNLGPASSVSERLLAEFLAIGAADQGYFSWEIDVLGLGYADGLEGCTGAQTLDTTVVAEAFLGLGSDTYSRAAASHYLASLALSGDGAAVEACSERAGSDASARADAILEFIALASGYAGEYSGSALSWAFRHCADDPAKALALVQYLDSGFIDDPLNSHSGTRPIIGGTYSPINRWLTETVTRNAEQVLQSVGQTAALLVWTEARELALQRATASAVSGEKHWRQYLYSQALTDSGNVLPVPLVAGDPEGNYGSVPRAAAGWVEGILADAFEKSDSKTSALSAALASWEGSLAERTVPATPASYLEAPEKPFSADDVVRASPLVTNEYQAAAGAYASLGYRKADSIVALTGFAKAFVIASDQSAVTARLAVLQWEQTSARTACDEAMLLFHQAGGAFDAAGVVYETAYSSANALYAAQETARSGYELEDAIRRWAGTAYLDVTEAVNPDSTIVAYRSPGTELQHARLSHERAATILDALLGLHSEDEEFRSYDDPEYKAASAAYEQNYQNLVLLARTQDSLGTVLAVAYAENEKAYKSYQANLFGSQESGYPPVAILPVDYTNYTYPADVSSVSWLDFLGLRADGSLGLAYSSDFRLTAINASTAEQLADYYRASPQSITSSNLHPASRYELDVRAWSSRVAGYMISQSAFSTWANARDYLLTSIAAANPEFQNLSHGVMHADNLNATIGQKRIDGHSITSELADYNSGPLAVEQRTAWESLAAQERADLEFYIVMSLSGGVERSADSLEAATKLKEYQFVGKTASIRIDASRRLAKKLRISAAATWALGTLLSWMPAGPPLLASAVVQFGLSFAATVDADDWQAIETTVVNPGLEVQRQKMLSGLSGLTDEHSGIQSSWATYQQSCERISVLQGACQDGADPLVVFRDSLETVDGLDATEIEKIITLYQAYSAETSCVYSCVSDALASVHRWNLSMRDVARSTMENCHFDDQRERQLAEETYHEVSEGYLAGIVTDMELESALHQAFGDRAASGKTHLERLARIEQSSVFNAGSDPLSRVQVEAAVSLAGLIDRASELRYSSELIAREAGWDLQRRDLNDKIIAWRQSASLIIERGRADFDKGADLLRGLANVWAQDFKDEYDCRKPVWDLAYAVMQDEKLSWVAQATETAGNASADAMLALMNPDAEAAARKFDSISVSRLAFDIEAKSYYDEIMQQAGIAGMEAAFALQSGSTAALSLIARKGVSNNDYLDSGRIITAAADFAEQSKQRISGVQARMMASRARSAATTAVDGLSASVRLANENYSKRMAEVFIDGGMWKRQGSRYVKDIVVHSTVGTPYITEQADVETFRNYTVSNWSLETDLSDSTLAGLGSVSVQELIARAQKEVQARHDQVFGTTEELGEAAVAARTRQVDVYRRERGVIDTRTVTWTDDDGKRHSREIDVFGMLDVLDHTEVQTEGAGEFGRHLGYAPVARFGANPDDGEDGVFQAAGSGEVGRLMAAYIYWSLKEGKGWSEANKPLYEKDLWDDRGDWLQAPTIRTVTDIGVTVAAGILTGGVGALAMNLVDDAAFGLLDISGGYQSWEQAGLDFGKKVALSGVQYSGSQMFGGAISSLASTGGLNQVIGTTVLTGVKTASLGVAASAIGAVNLTHDGHGGISGIGFDAEGFKEGAFGEASVASYLGAMSGAAFNASLDFNTAYSRKLWSGLTNIGSMAATESVEFATHLGYSAASGVEGSSLFDDAWKNHGGIGIDVANIGSIMSAAGFLYGVSSNGYSASERSRYTEISGAFSGTGLTLTLGADGVQGSFGGGGYDLVQLGMQLGKGLSLDAKLEKYAIAQGSTVGSVLKTALGYGDSAAEETVWRIVSGRDTLSIGTDVRSAETHSDSNGNRIIRLLASGGGTSAMLDMAVTLQHESWRDGRTGTTAGQSHETMMAAKAHTEMTLGLALGNEYSTAMASLIGNNQNYRNDLGNYLNGDFASYVGQAYDASGDYWKLTKDGGLLNDSKARLFAEIVNDDGTTGWFAVEDSQTETSSAAALVHYLGPTRSMELFSGSLCDITRYDDQTLHDVLNLDYVDIKTIRNNPGEAERLIATASSSQRDKLLGEALMKNAGIEWSTGAQVWAGNGTGLTLSDRAIIGAAAIRSVGGGNYERFSITSEIERREGAYGVWINGVKGDVGEGNTRLSFTKWDIDSGEQLATIVAGGAWNSVDNSYGQLDSKGKPIGADQQYQIVFGPTLQGNTIAEGPLNLRLALTPKSDWGDVLILSDTKTIAGEKIMGDGRRPGYPLDYRWLGHATNYGSSDGCPVYKRGDDSSDQFVALMRSLETWGLYGGYSISGLLIDDNEFPYQVGYRKGAW